MPTVSRIAVMPVVITGNHAFTAGLTTGKAVLNGLIHDYFVNNPRVNILSEAQINSYGHHDSDWPLIKKIGRRLHADTVMTWQLNRYVEKDGGDYSVNHPSSVAFSYRLMNIASGQTICSSKVDKTQDTLTGNLFSAKRFLSHGGKWISAQRLTREVMTRTLQKCRYLSMPKAK
jgi:hypothetical protein